MIDANELHRVWTCGFCGNFGYKDRCGFPGTIREHLVCEEVRK